MSVNTFVFLRDERLPTLGQWQAALDKAGTGIVLHQVADLRHHSGYLPATYRGQPSGFERYYGPVSGAFGDSIPNGIGKRDYVAQLRLGSDICELLCAVVAGAVLAQFADGCTFDNGSGPTLDGEAAVEEARRLERELGFA